MYFDEGRLVLKELPLAFALFVENVSTYCDNCFIKTIKLSCCSVCKVVKYCNRKCQKERWNCHKMECAFVKTSGIVLPANARVLFFLLNFQVILCYDMFVYIKRNKIGDDFYNLMSRKH